MKKKIRITLYAVLCVSMELVAARQMNKLRKAVYYVGRGQAVKSASIDLGKIVLFFDEKPIMNLLPDKNRSATKETLIFFFPFSLIGGDNCKKMVDIFNVSKNKHYTFHLKQVNKPLKGLELSIVYNPSKVGWDQRYFKTIKSNMGFEIRLHDRGVLEAIQKGSTDAPRVATVKKKQSLLTVGMEGMILAQLVVVA